MPAYKLNVGDLVPKFAAKDYEGELLTTDDLLGAPSVVYFYPKDDTPNCTKEACDFRDHMEDFEDIDVVVLGISPDGMVAHQKFMKKHDLNFTLLSDETLEVAKKFGVWEEKTGKIERTTFVLDSECIIRWVERPVQVEGHVKRVLNALKEACFI